MATITIEHLLRNHVPVGQVGDGCTLLLYSDSHAATIITRTRCTITVQRDKAIVVGGPYQIGEERQYRYERDVDAPNITYRWSAEHGWINRKVAASRCLVGERREYQDPTF